MHVPSQLRYSSGTHMSCPQWSRSHRSCKPWNRGIQHKNQTHSTWQLVVRRSVVVACFGDQNHPRGMRTIIKRRIGIEPGFIGSGTSTTSLVITNAIGIRIGETRPAAFAQGIKLVAVAVAVAFRDVRTSALRRLLLDRCTRRKRQARPRGQSSQVIVTRPRRLLGIGVFCAAHPHS